jgi:anthranilate phosphoribosyltransferase
VSPGERPTAAALLRHLLAREPLDDDLADAFIAALVDPSTPDALKGALLAALSAKGESGRELRGLALALRNRAAPVACPPGAADTCGTGGDDSGSFNVSTAAALVVAAAGVPVVKHGNRAVSGRCGSADVLEALRVPLSHDADAAARSLDRAGFAFLLAPSFHQATAAIRDVRRALGVRTAFNLLGPLTNPAAPPFQLVGAWDADAGERLAAALAELPITRAAVVHGAPGWDEATPCGPFLRWDVTPGHFSRREIDPLFSYGLPRRDPSELAGGDALDNARLMRDVLSGARGALRDTVLLNAAIVLELALELTPREALNRAAHTIDSGAAAWLLDRTEDGP